MFDIGFSELVLIALLALLVLGPKRLPEMARAAGRWMAKLRHFISGVKQDFEGELRNAEIMELQKLKQELDDTRRMMEDSSGRLMQTISEMPSSSETPRIQAEAAAAGSAMSPANLAQSPAPPRAPRQAPKKKSTKPTSNKRSHGRARKARRTQHD